MTPRVLWDRRAEADLDDIWDYVGRQRQSISAADRLIDSFSEKALAYAHQPEMGTLHPELAADLRSFRVGGYVAFYLPFDDGIIVIRIVDGHRDYSGYF